LAEEHSFADPDWAGSGSPVCGCLHKAEESTDEDQSAWEPVKLQDSSAKHGIFPGQLFLSVDLQNDKRIIVMLLLM
jgi:hypothetical protein